MPKKILVMISQILVTPTKSVEGAAAILAVSILLSRLLGLIRYRLLAAAFGDKILILDSFLAASNVPEVIFEVLIFGSISVAFIPIFSSLLVKGQREKAWHLAQTLVNSTLILFFILALILVLAANQISFLVAPGLVIQHPETRDLIANLIRVMVISQFFFLLGIFATSILQSYQNFLVPAVAPAVYNLGIIFGIIVLSPRFGIFGPAFGMVIGSVAFLVIQLLLITRFGSIFSARIDFSQSEVKKVVYLAWPRVIGLAAARGMDWINIAFASLTGAGSIVALNFAQNLAAVPIGLFGSAIAQAALPTLSAQFARKDLPNFKKTFVSSLHQIFFLTFPAITLIAILRIPAIRLVYGAANFPWETTLLTGRILIILSASIAAQSTLLLLVRAFYALGDSKTPIIAGLVSFFINSTLAILFIPILHLPVTFLAAAFAFSNFLYAALLIYLLNEKVGGFGWKFLITPTSKMIAASILAAVAAYFPFKFLDVVLDTSKTMNVLILTIASGLFGLTSYFIFNLIFGVHQARMIRDFFSRLKFPKQILTTETFKN